MEKKTVLSIVVLFTCLFAIGRTYADSPSAQFQVTAWGMHYGGQVIYKYQVKNLGTEAISRVLIGHYSADINGGAELSVKPLDPARTSFWLSPQAAGRPDGWAVKVFFEEESSKFSLDWIESSYYKQLWPNAPKVANSPSATAIGHAIIPGATSEDFSVSLPSIDSGYVQGHVSVMYGDDLVNVALIKGDSTPPVINLLVNRLNQNGGDGTWAIFDVNASATDNYDPMPSLTCEPITSNQPMAPGDVVAVKNGRSWNVKLRNVLGRTYQIKFTSIDASGNMSIKIYDYVVTSK